MRTSTDIYTVNIYFTQCWFSNANSFQLKHALCTNLQVIPVSFSSANGIKINLLQILYFYNGLLWEPLGLSVIQWSYSWKTYFLNSPLSPLIETDKLLVFLPFHCIVMLFTAQKKQRDFQNSEPCSILTVGRAGLKGRGIRIYIKKGSNK